MSHPVHYYRKDKRELTKKRFGCLPLQKRMFFILITLLFCLSPSLAQTDKYPQAVISNQHVVMKLYLPDPVIGYYRATRFDWSGIIYSLEFQGHQYFGEWKTTHDPFSHEDITGPVESFGSPGLGYDESEPGGEFIRIGVGILEKMKEPEYGWNKTYKILDNGVWKVDQGKDWIEFRHELKSKAGWGYIYTKKIVLMKEMPGFSIIHVLKNTGQKTIDTDQYNHNFFVIDHENTGPDFQVKFPFRITTENDLKGLVKFDHNMLSFTKKLTEGSIWLALKGYGTEAADHQIELINNETGAGVRIKVNQPLYRLVFWATTTTLCPENFIKLTLIPGEEKTWISDYTLFSGKR
jgi:hypothetical protein